MSRVLVPLVDMVNHRGVGHNALVDEADDLSITLRATRDIAAGEEARPVTCQWVANWMLQFCKAREGASKAPFMPCT